MKLSAVTVACLATGVYSRIAEPPTRVYERDIATVTGAINAVGEGIDKLDQDVKAFSGDVGPVKDSADKLISTLKDSESKVKGSDKLSLSDALGLQEPVKDLQSKSETLVSDFEGHKKEIEQGGYCDTVREKLGSINTGSRALIDAVVSKVPEEAQGIAKNLASGLTKVLDKANDDFSEKNCKSGGGKSSSASKPSSPSTSAGSSSSAPSSEPSSPATTAEPSSPASSSAEPSSPSSSDVDSDEPTATATSGATYPTHGGSATSHVQPTGTGAPTGQPPSQSSPITAGAGAVVPAGVMVVAAALMAL